METILKQQQNLSFRAVTITDLNAIISLYQQQNTSFTESNLQFNHQFGLPLYVAEWDNEIVGYSYVATTNSDDYCLKTTINTTFSNYPINEHLILESEIFFESEWQNDSHKKLKIAIDQLVNWLNNSKS